MWNIDEKGWICGDAGVICVPRTFVERATLSYVKGVIVHQTVCATVEAALNSYQRSDANGAHFLIGRDGRTYQLASLFQKNSACPKIPSAMRGIAFLQRS